MALIPGTLPTDTCYGSPQNLLELFAQFLDIPAVALQSKVFFSTTAPTDPASIWIDTNTPTNPIMKLTVSSAFVDYVKNYITQAPVATIVGADSVLILDATDGNTKRGLVSDIAALAVPAPGSVTPAQLSQPFTRATAVAASGSSVSFTSIPSWAKRITVMFNGISSNGTNVHKIRLGTSSGDETSGYTGVTANIGDTGAFYSLLSNGFDIIQTGAATIVYYGQMTLSNLSGNIWTCNSIVGRTDNNFFGLCAGAKTLGGTLDRITLTTSSAQVFDNGTINITYEG
jgi:hypothetical protein